MATYRLSEPSVCAKVYPPPRQIICEWCGDWTDEVVRVRIQSIALSGLSAEEVMRRFPHTAAAIGKHEATCPERERIGGLRQHSTFGGGSGEPGWWS